MMNCYADGSDPNECDQSENNSSDSIPPNNLCNIGMDFDIDNMLENIEQIQDDEGLDEITFHLLSECNKRVETLKKIQQHSVELQSAIDSSKYHLTELEELQNEEQQKVEAQKKEIEAKRLVLEELKSQKVNDLTNLEDYMHRKSEDFITAPQLYDSRTLEQEVEQLEKYLSDQTSELNQYKEDLIQEQEKFKEITSDDNILAPLRKIFDEDVTDINSLDKKLKLEVEQLTSELNMVRVEFNLLTKRN